MSFAGCDPVTKGAWPCEWVPIVLLKSNLKRAAREMESRLAAAAPPPVAAGSKRSWAGLGWEGADEGLPRRAPLWPSQFTRHE